MGDSNQLPVTVTVKRSSAEYKANPDDYNVLDNGTAVAKSARQKRMEELERKYSRGSFDKTPTMPTMDEY